MANFTISQLETKPGSYSIVGTDLLLHTTGTSTPFLSSVKLTNNDYVHYLSQNFGTLSATGTTYTNYFAGDVGIGTSSPNANAALDVTSSTKAFMPPRMTTTERDAVASPTAG